MRKYLLALLAGVALSCAPLGAQWTPDNSKTNVENLKDLLAEREAAYENDEANAYLKLHFWSMRQLIQEYPPSESQAAGMITAFNNPTVGGGPFRYQRGERQLVIAYISSGGGKLSYVRYQLPSRWQPTNKYPVYVWARGGGANNYPADIIDAVYGPQVSGDLIEGCASAVYKDGFTLMPGCLGGRSYEGDQELDFIDGVEAVRSRFLTDENRYYMGGFSNGGKATYFLGSRTMDRFKWAALGMCAPAVRSNLTEEYAMPLKNTPVWMAVGANDSSWRPTTHDTRDILTAIGNPPEVYYEVPGLGHQWTWDFQLNMYEFMKAHTYTPVDPFSDDPAISYTVSPTQGKLQVEVESPFGTLVKIQESDDLESWTEVDDVLLKQNAPNKVVIEETAPTEVKFYRLAK